MDNYVEKYHQHTRAPTRKRNDTIGGVQVKKLPYSPPTLSILETDEIANGISKFHEGDGGGLVS